MDKTLSFGVCDDDEIVCEAICTRIIKILKNCGIAASCDKYVSPVALYRNIERGNAKYDALFLDIDMPKLNGIDLAKAVKSLKEGPEIVFVSNREDMVFETFKVRPFGFIRKNNFTHDLHDVLRSYINVRIIGNTFIALKTNNNSVLRKVKVSDIVYIESFHNKQFVYLSDGECLECLMQMSDFEQKLSKYDILRIYRSYLVNLKYVQRIERTGVLVNFKDGITLSVSRDKVQELKKTYLNYLRKIGTVLFEED